MDKDRDPRATELANLKEALANFGHKLDAYEARIGRKSKASQPHCPTSTDPHIAFANEVVAAMKDRTAEGHCMVGIPGSHPS
ncbi:hypothetical protein CQ14_28295 [Bradyrhizobium lablabi]|uniref:Uncharacterized protein n=1 Tax=Bradyrhizobium lablabi TaxID=722472 RepID=A0A0R3M5C4_9BRAD|nr:hypothetical protein [Bradyrhizobium lablabi]KRR15225.1 hypothetical protein CQ14_28295 [Bradyrhizobium lablabi]